ncbi:MAG: biopolymer transporter ExbD [Deltaproteobacteria bacterium]|nr:biopolymer transporter ExbD [Deltaproteobacteria bacterium]
MKVNMAANHKSRIEMLPLIDIVFLLLVVFIYTMLSMAVHHGLRLSLPTSSVAEIEKHLVLSVTVKRDGTVYIDKEPVALNALIQTLESKSLGHPNPGVLLFADNALSYQNLFQVLDRIKMAGLSRISLQAEVVK